MEAIKQKGETNMTKRFQVREWDTDKVLYEFDKLAIAKKYARGQGHTGEDNPMLTGYPPIAFVWDVELDGCCYNPRFGKNISSELAGLVNSRPSGTI